MVCNLISSFSVLRYSFTVQMYRVDWTCCVCTGGLVRPKHADVAANVFVKTHYENMLIQIYRKYHL